MDEGKGRGLSSEGRNLGTGGAEERCHLSPNRSGTR